MKDKKHAIHIDTLCQDNIRGAEAKNLKLDKMYTAGAPPLKELLPEILSTPRRDHTGGRLQERQRQKGTLVVIESSLRLEEQAKLRWQATTMLLEQCKAGTANALKRTQMEMGTKIADTEILKQELIK